jgi:hypothetical protein
MDWPELIATALKIKKTDVLETAQALNSRVNPNTSAPKMVPGRYDPVYQEGGTGNRNMEAYLKLLADRRIMLRNLNPKATYSTVRIRS